MAGLKRGSNLKGKQRASSVDSSSSSSSDRAPKFEHIQPHYRNQPIPPQAGDAKLNLIIHNLSTLKKQLRDAVESIVNAASDAAESEATGDERDDDDEIPVDSETIKSLDLALRSTIDQQTEIDIRTSVLSEIRQKFARGQVIADLLKVYEDKVAKEMLKMEKMTARQKYVENETYVSFRTTIWENLYSGQPVPNIKRMVPAEENDEEDSDDDLEIGAQKEDFKDPLTLTILQEPMSSKICKHSFSRASITDYLRQPPTGAGKDCPIPGCPKKLKLGDMFPNKNLEKRVENHVRRLRDMEEQERQRKGTQYQTLEDSDEEE